MCCPSPASRKPKKLKNWPNESVPAWCGKRRWAWLAVALAAAASPGAAQPQKSPLLVLLGGDAKAWQAECQRRGWLFLEPWNQPVAGSPDRSEERRVGKEC